MLLKSSNVAWITPIITSITLPIHAETSCTESEITINADEFIIDYDINGAVISHPVLEIHFQNKEAYEFTYLLEISDNNIPKKYSAFKQNAGIAIGSTIQKN